MMRTSLTALIAVAGLGASSGCNNVECGEGTFSSGDTCVGFDPDDKTPPVTTISPRGGRSRDPIPTIVTLTTDEPARIIYTTDGSEPDPAASGEPSPVSIVDIAQGTTIKFFAIDRAGNQEAVATTTFDSDTEPPPPVSGLTVTLAGTTATVTWTNPTATDFAGTVLARVTDAIDANPVAGSIVTQGLALSPSIQVISVGTVTQFEEVGLPAGPVRYAAWTFDDLGNYSGQVAASAEIPLGPPAAQLTFDASTSTLTTTQSPAGFDLAGTTATLSGTTLTLALSLENNTAKYFQNPKLAVTGVTNASFSNADGSADGAAFRSLGPDLLAPGATKTADLVFTGVLAGTTVTIDLAVAHHPSLLWTSGRNGQQQGMLDLGSGQLTPALVMTSTGPSDRKNGRTRPGQMIGGRYLDVPTTHGTVERWDLVSRTSSKVVSFGTGDRLNVQALVEAGGHRFAVLKYGGHRRIGDSELVRLDESLTVTGRLMLPRQERKGFAPPALSADGSTLALALDGGLMLVDTRTLTPIDATPSTPILDLIVPGFVENIRGAAFFDGTAGLVVMARSSGRAAFIHRTADGYTVTPYQDATTTAKGYGIATAPDGRVWMAFASGIRAYDPGTGAVTTVSYASGPHGVANLDGKMWIIRTGRTILDQVSNTGSVERTITLPSTSGAYGHWLGLAR